MLLDPNKSLCEKKQKIIVSKDNRESRTHIATNPSQRYLVRHYRLDGDLVKQQECCDFLLLNDSSKRAYYIELKGKDIKKAISQLLAAELICSPELKGYLSYFRIVASKSPTHNMYPKSYRDLFQKVGKNRLICKTNRLEETL